MWHSPELVLLVSCLDVARQLVEAARVLELDLGAAPEVVLQLGEHADVRVLPHVQTPHLLAQLRADLCNTHKHA